MTAMLKLPWTLHTGKTSVMNISNKMFFQSLKKQYELKLEVIFGFKKRGAHIYSFLINRCVFLP